jgi:predicted AlkP superfamily pyrophosphatase or phosphodiesterase
MQPFAVSLLMLSLFAAPHAAADSHAPRVLIIGIDGCRTDALAVAETPNLDGLIREGCMSDDTRIFGSRETGSDTSSGPGWSSILTGVWADKHGVVDNDFQTPRFNAAPPLFVRLRQQRPAAFSAAVGTWPPLHEKIVAGADVNECFLEKDEDWAAGDERTAARAVELLTRPDLELLFVYFGNVDETGHDRGFHPQSAPYRKAIETVDQLAGRVLDAMRKRPAFAREDWLVLVCTDHGGEGLRHGDGHKNPNIHTVFLIASGPSAQRGRLKETTYLVDVPVTAMTHLGLTLDPAWKLDGRAVGLRSE